MEKQRILSITVDNVAGIINKVTGLIMRKGFSIDSLAVSETENTKMSCMTITLSCDDKGLERAIKQLDTLIDVVKVEELTQENAVSREHILITTEAKEEIEQIVKKYKANIIKQTSELFVIEFTGITQEANTFLETMLEHGIISIARSGKIAVGITEK